MEGFCYEIGSFVIMYTPGLKLFVASSICYLRIIRASGVYLKDITLPFLVRVIDTTKLIYGQNIEL